MNIEPIIKFITVEVSQEKAFKVFTEKFDCWWPSTHHIGKSKMKKAILEPTSGGRWYEICEDGSQCDWGKVIEWNPFHHLKLYWQINGMWQYDPLLLTEVEITFTPENENRTRVKLEHRNLEKFGATVHEARKNLDSEGGWSGLLRLFAKEAQK